jgi:type IV pilus assembly protein PilE
MRDNRWVSSRCGRGFSLVELMVVAAILGILLAIAVPGYREHVAKSKRADGMGVLSEAAQFMERNFSDCGVYNQTSATCNVAIALPLALTTAPRGDTNSYYAISLSAVNATTFTLQAAPINSMSGDACGTFTLTSTGVKNVTGGSKTKDQCWR